MNYKINIGKSALKFINKQPQKEKVRLYRAIYALPNGDVIKMAGSRDLFRLRVGGYRVIYSMENDTLVIHVIEVGSRGDVYK